MRGRAHAVLTGPILGIVCLFAAGRALAGEQTGAELGRAIYTNCAACHGDAGQGGYGPPLAGRPLLADKNHAISKVLTGSLYMPPFRDQLSPQEIAAVMNWMSRSWGGGAAMVTPAEVASIAARLEASGQ